MTDHTDKLPPHWAKQKERAEAAERENARLKESFDTSQKTITDLLRSNEQSERYAATLRDDFNKMGERAEAAEYERDELRAENARLRTENAELEKSRNHWCHRCADEMDAVLLLQKRLYEAKAKEEQLAELQKWVEQNGAKFNREETG